MEDLFLTAGPHDLDGPHFHRFAQSEVCAQVALREITSTSCDLAYLRQSTCHDADSCAHSISVAFGSNQSEIHKVISIPTTIVQQQRLVSVVANNNVHKTVVIQVCEGDSPADIRRLKSISRHLSCLDERALSVVVEERIDLFEVCTSLNIFDLRIHVSVGDKQVEPAVIVIVEEASAETKHVVGGTDDVHLMTDVPKPALAVVMEDVIRRLLKIGDKQVKPAIVIVVAQ